MEKKVMTDLEKKAQGEAVELFEAFRASMPDIDVNAKPKTKNLVTICCNRIIKAGAGDVCIGEGENAYEVSGKTFYEEVLKQLARL